MIVVRFPTMAIIFLFATTPSLALGYSHLIDTGGCFPLGKITGA
jgi:hypothetical protein